MSDQKRNLNPHKPAKAAMYLFSSRYAAQNGGSMDFWDSLSKQEQDFCRRCVADIESSQDEPRS